MSNRLRIPIRFKILVTMLFVVTFVVGAITFTMANLFHHDKKAYINGLVSMMSLSTGEETRSLLISYQERLQVYARVIRDEDLAQADKARLLHALFEEFPELVSVSLYRDGEQAAAATNGAVLEAAGIDRETLARERESSPLPFDRILGGETYVANSTVSAELPCLTLAVAPETTAEEGEIVVAGVIQLENLQRLSRRSPSFETFIADSDGVLLAHPKPKRVARRDRVKLLPEVLELQESIGAGLASEYVDRGVDFIGGFAPVGVGNLIAGVQVERSVAYLASRRLLSSLLVVALVLLVLSTLAGLFWARRITRPVERLSGATREIARGRFDVEVQVDSRDEIGALAGSFNQMASELKDRDDALEEAQSQLVQSEKMAAFGQLGAGIAHEVKNPLAGILGVAQLALRKTEKESPITKNLQLIEKETKRCKTIIENLLRFARQERAVMQPTAVNSVIEDAIAIVNHQLEMNKIDVQRDLDDSLPRVHGNSNQLQQVLMNLMINAQQAMEGEPGTVKMISRLNEDGDVELRVSDTGPGIPDSVREKLFEPFFTTKPGGKGTGLGLSVSFGIIQDHGGEITIDTAPGEGATFIITLPKLQEHSSTPTASAQGA